MKRRGGAQICVGMFPILEWSDSPHCRQTLVTIGGVMGMGRQKRKSLSLLNFDSAPPLTDCRLSNPIGFIRDSWSCAVSDKVRQDELLCS